MSGKKGQKGAKPTDVPNRFNEAFLETLDGRVRVARVLRENFIRLTNDLGGIDQLSYLERSLVKRVLHLERQIEQDEAALAAGQEFDRTNYVTAINTLMGLANKLGLKRRAKLIPSLSEYLKAKQPEGAA